MHQRLNLQVQEAMEELKEEQELLEIKHGSKPCMYLCIEREEARNQAASLSLERRSSVALAQPALKREKASKVGQVSASPSLEREPTLKREEDSEPPSLTCIFPPHLSVWLVVYLDL